MFINSNVSNNDTQSQIKSNSALEAEYPVLFIKNATYNCSNKMNLINVFSLI